jgi:hypothetical protein
MSEQTQPDWRHLLLELVSKLDEVYAHPQYRAVWESAWIHGCRYGGPTYERELKAAREALGVKPRAE